MIVISTTVPPHLEPRTFAPQLVLRPGTRRTARVLRRDDWPRPAPDDAAFDVDEWDGYETDDEQH